MLLYNKDLKLLKNCKIEYINIIKIISVHAIYKNCKFVIHDYFRDFSIKI